MVFSLQACAYKVGELKIKELRRRAGEELGETLHPIISWSIRAIHDFLNYFPIFSRGLGMFK